MSPRKGRQKKTVLRKRILKSNFEFSKKKVKLRTHTHSIEHTHERI